MELIIRHTAGQRMVLAQDGTDFIYENLNVIDRHGRTAALDPHSHQVATKVTAMFARHINANARNSK